MSHFFSGRLETCVGVAMTFYRISRALRSQLEESGWEDDLKDMAKGRSAARLAMLNRRRAGSSSRNTEPPGIARGDHRAGSK